MVNTFRPYDPDQQLLLPAALQEWLPPDHLAYFISDVVDQLDLSVITARYEEQRGGPPVPRQAFLPVPVASLGNVTEILAWLVPGRLGVPRTVASWPGSAATGMVGKCGGAAANCRGGLINEARASAGVAPVPYRQNKHILFGQQEGRCKGCRSAFEFRHLEVDHVIPRDSGGHDHVENLQLLCAHCNRIKSNRSLEYLMAQLAEMGITA